VEQQIQFAEFLANLREDARDFIVARDITGYKQCISAKRAGQFLHIFLQPLPLVGEREFGARLGPGLCDGPGNRTLVCDAKDDARFAFQ
jgi:hypothetical protein